MAKRKTTPRSTGTRLDHIASFDDEGHLRVVVESPKGSPMKLAFDPDIGAMTLSRPLPSGVVFPFDFGFVPGTLAPDGDPLDALVLHDSASYPGVVIACDVVGAVGLEEDGEDGARRRNDRLIVIPAEDPRARAEHGASALTARWKKELEQFFRSATFFERKNVKILGWLHKTKAMDLVGEARKKHRK
jgi:inorganic pyrophosphatase